MEHYKVIYEFYRDYAKIAGKMLDNTMRHYVRRCVEVGEQQQVGMAGIEWSRLMGIVELMFVHKQYQEDHESQVNYLLERLAIQKVRCQKYKKLLRDNNIDISNV